MIALLDANLLIALFDQAHLHHQEAHRWLTRNRGAGWATCPFTQIACIRVLSHPSYPGRLTVADMGRRLQRATTAPDHSFWHASLPPCDATHFALEKVLTPKPLTDLYLVALAVANQGRLVTFDQGISLSALPNAKPENLLVLQTPP